MRALPEESHNEVRAELWSVVYERVFLTWSPGALGFPWNTAFGQLCVWLGCSSQ